MFRFFFIFFHVLSNLNSWGQSFGFDLTCHPASSASHGAATLLASGSFQVKLTQVVWPSMFDRRPAAGARCWCTEKLRVCGPRGSQWLTCWYQSMVQPVRAEPPTASGCLPGWQRHRTSSPWMWAFLELGEMMLSSICGFCWLFEYLKIFKVLFQNSCVSFEPMMEIRAFTFLVPPVAMSFTSGLVESCINAAVHVGFCEFRRGSGPKKRRQLRLFSTRFWKILDGLHNQNTLSDLRTVVF